MPYDPQLVQPMREELSRVGVQELTSQEQVESFMAESSGTALLIVNSVCGCAAGGARPAISIAMQHENCPNRVASVFAGQDVEATEKARSYFAEFPPSSPCFVLFKDGKVVHFVPRHGIEGRDPQSIAFDLVSTFDTHCTAKAER
ncbi:MAG: BrxA/BrxB family bacilliredoxin [Planctomycetota bacterium]